VACERVEFRATFYVDGKEVKSKAVVWVSTSVPFSYKSWEESGWLLGWEALQFKPRKPPVGALIRAELESWDPKLFKTKENVAKSVIRLIKFGADAKPDLYLRK
jgi:hypothetical protein